jgi:hypothetical protein
MNPTSYSMPPSHVSHALLDKHIWWRPTKFLFGGCMTPLSTQLGNISEISTPGLNLVGKYSSSLWASKQPHQVTKPLYMPEIMNYHSTLAASTLNILFLEILKFSKILLSTKSNLFLLRKVKHLLKYFIFNMESSKLINYSKDIH